AMQLGSIAGFGIKARIRIVAVLGRLLRSLERQVTAHGRIQRVIALAVFGMIVADGHVEGRRRVIAAPRLESDAAGRHTDHVILDATPLTDDRTGAAGLRPTRRGDQQSRRGEKTENRAPIEPGAANGATNVHGRKYDMAAEGLTSPARRHG